MPAYWRLSLFAFGVLIAVTLLFPAIVKAFPARIGGAAAPVGSALFVDATSSSGLLASQSSCLPDVDKQYFVTGQAWGDADGDGITDLYVTNQCGPSTLFASSATKTLRECSAISG